MASGLSTTDELPTMRIAYVAAGAAGMYCGSCLHDNTLASALLTQGHEVALIPTYTPIRTDEANVSIEPVFYGAINVFLQQRSEIFSRAPEFLHRWLDRPGLLNWVSRFAASTSGRELGALTLSMLQAEQGHQKSELERLLVFLEDFEPEIVQLTNAMFLGIGAAIKSRLGVPVVSGLTGEDLFLAELPEPYLEQVRREMIRHAAQIDGFVATSHYYAAEMTKFMEVETERMHVVPLGIALDDFAGIRPSSHRSDASIVIGYLARICPEKGLHLLLDAFRLLVSQDKIDLKLKVAGYLGPRDRQYFEDQKRRLAEWGLLDRVELIGEVDRQQKLDLLNNIDLLSVPTTYKEPKGLFAIEAWAASVPTVLPSHGAFPELVDVSQGGVLVTPHSVEDLARGIRDIIADPIHLRSIGESARTRVEEEFSAAVMAGRTATLYRSLVDRPSSDPQEVTA